MPFSHVDHWTVRDVERWLVVAYRLDPRDTSPGARLAIGWIPERIYGQAERAAVHLWAWATAHGENISELCRNRGIPRKTFYRRVERGICQIVDSLNLDIQRRLPLAA